MTNTIQVDFGAEEAAKKRDYQEKLNWLLDLVKRRDEDYLNNPKKFFEMAGKEIHDRDTVIQRANEALRPPVPRYGDWGNVGLDLPATIRVDANELARLRTCAKIIEEWHNQ